MSEPNENGLDLKDPMDYLAATIIDLGARFRAYEYSRQWGRFERWRQALRPAQDKENWQWALVRFKDAFRAAAEHIRTAQ